MSSASDRPACCLSSVAACSWRSEGNPGELAWGGGGISGNGAMSGGSAKTAALLFDEFSN